MKNIARTTITTFWLISFSIVSYVVTAEEVVKAKCEGKMGDVKMSLLNPDQFKKQNGVCWLPMEGQNIEGTPLASTVSEIDGKLPDASGRFFRVLDRTGKIDEYVTKKIKEKGKRPVGSLQNDQTGPHKHPIRITKQQKDFNLYKWGNPKEAKDSYDGSTWKRQYWRGKESGNTSTLKTNETRPKNIAIYAYVHVGE